MSNSTYLDFELARKKHLEFKLNLKKIINGDTSVDEKPLLSHYECGVGKWIYSFGIIKLAHLTEMYELERVHASIHIVAKEIIELYRTGKVEEAKAEYYRIETIAKKLIFLLEVLEQKVK